MDELFSLIDLSKDSKLSKEQYISFRGSIVFDAFAVRTTHNSASIKTKDSVPLNPKSRDLYARSSVTFFSPKGSSAPPEVCELQKEKYPFRHLCMISVCNMATTILTKVC